MIDPGKILVIIAGVGEYSTDSSFPSLPSALNNIQDLREYFTTIIGLNTNRLLYLDNFSNTQLLSKINEWLKEKRDLGTEAIFFYYSGHAPFAMSKNGSFDFYITAADSCSDDDFTFINCKALFDRLRPEKYKDAKLIAVFDCCFSKGINSALPPSQAYDYYVITSTSRTYDYAKYPEGQRNSVFTEAFLRVLRQGINSIDDERLSMDEIFVQVDESLADQKPSSFGDQAQKEEFLPNMKMPSIAVIDKGNEINEIAWAIAREQGNNEMDDLFLARRANGIAENLKEDDSDKKSPKEIVPKFPVTISTLIKIFFSDETIDNPIRAEETYEKIYLQILKFLCYIAIKDITDNYQEFEKLKLQELDPKIITPIKEIWKSKNRSWLFEVLTRILFYNKGNSSRNLIIKEFIPQSVFFESIFRIELGKYQIHYKDVFKNDRLIIDGLNTLSLQNDPFNFRKALLNLFKGLAFFTNYNFIAVRLISASRGYLMPVTFRHDVYNLFGNGYNDKVSIDTRDKCYHNGTVLIFPKSQNLQGVLDSGRYINLWPLIIDKFSYSKKDEKPVIYMFEKAQIDALEFFYSITSEEKKMTDVTPYYNIVDVVQNEDNNQKTEYFKRFKEKIVGL